MEVISKAVISMLVFLSCFYVSRVLADRELGPCEMSVEAGNDLVWRRDAADCSSAYMCLLGRTVTYACPEGFVIGADTTGCVPEGSTLDDCTITLPDSHLTPPCKHGMRSPDETNCAKYFECVSLPDGNATMMSRECEYPKLFDMTTMNCKPFHQVLCLDGQHVPKGQCEYETNQCASAHCVPCNVRFPSCIGLSDGLNPWIGREWSPSYVICEEERVMYQGMCQQENETKIFHPELRTCVVPDEKLF